MPLQRTCRSSVISCQLWGNLFVLPARNIFTFWSWVNLWFELISVPCFAFISADKRDTNSNNKHASNQRKAKLLITLVPCNCLYITLSNKISFRNHWSKGFVRCGTKMWNNAIDCWVPTYNHLTWLLYLLRLGRIEDIKWYGDQPSNREGQNRYFVKKFLFLSKFVEKVFSHFFQQCHIKRFWVVQSIIQDVVKGSYWLGVNGPSPCQWSRGQSMLSWQVRNILRLLPLSSHFILIEVSVDAECSNCIAPPLKKKEMGTKQINHP